MSEHGRPSVLIVGGFATLPPNYWAFRRRLLRRGVERVDICQLWPPDWALAGIVGFGPILRRTGRTIAATYGTGGRRPIIVIAHSAGGIATRLAMSNVPFNGRLAGVSEAVGCLVTLGTPHGLLGLSNRYRHAGHEAAAFLERETPGAYFYPRTGYLTVGARIAPTSTRLPTVSVSNEVFRMLVGEGPEMAGDGIVPVAAAHLEGARQMTFEGVRHGMIGSPWYGDDEVMDRWWPTAVELWHAALDARAGGESCKPIAERSAAEQLRMGDPVGRIPWDSRPVSTRSGLLEHDLREALDLQVAGWSSGSSSGS